MSAVTEMVDLSEVQGNVMRSYGSKYHWARFVFLKAKDAHSETRAAVAKVLAEVTFGDPTRSAGNTSPDSCVNVAFPHRGLTRLGIPLRARGGLPPAYAAGAWSRASALRDHWHERKDAIRLDRSDLLISVHSRNGEAGAARCDAVIGMLEDRFDSVHSLVTTFPLDGGDRERFGFADGLSQPAVEGVDADAVGDGVYAVARPRTPGWRSRSGLLLENLGLRALAHDWRLIRTGEFLLGYENEDGELPQGSDSPLGPNSTFMVYREIDEDVGVFNKYVTNQSEAAGLSTEHLRAKIVGRWSNGTSAIRQHPDPDDVAKHQRRANDFLYSQDPHGFACPLGAHTRRGNPRDTLPGGAEQTARHRIIRRGMPYEKGGDAKRTDREGLAFVCFGASIENGFEYIQRNWINGGEAFGLGTQRDFLLQDWRDGEKGTPMVIPGYRPHILTPPPDKPFVKVRGCAYLFVPSRSACTWLSNHLLRP